MSETRRCEQHHIKTDDGKYQIGVMYKPKSTQFSVHLMRVEDGKKISIHKEDWWVKDDKMATCTINNLPLN